MGRGFRGSVEERFWKKVSKDGRTPEHRPELGPCWEWTGFIHSGGYGVFREHYEQGSRSAHVLAFELVVGPVPEGKELDHLCRVRHCVRPDHLEPVPHRVNVLRGEGITAQWAKRDACNHGHEFTPENTQIRSDSPGARRCRTCRREESRSRKRNRRVA